MPQFGAVFQAAAALPQIAAALPEVDYIDLVFAQPAPLHPLMSHYVTQADFTFSNGKVLHVPGYMIWKFRDAIPEDLGSEAYGYHDDNPYSSEHGEVIMQRVRRAYSLMFTQGGAALPHPPLTARIDLLTRKVKEHYPPKLPPACFDALGDLAAEYATQDFLAGVQTIGPWIAAELAKPHVVLRMVDAGNGMLRNQYSEESWQQPEQMLFEEFLKEFSTDLHTTHPANLHQMDRFTLFIGERARAVATLAYQELMKRTPDLGRQVSKALGTGKGSKSAEAFLAALSKSQDAEMFVDIVWGTWYQMLRHLPLSRLMRHPPDLGGFIPTPAIMNAVRKEYSQRWAQGRPLQYHENGRLDGWPVTLDGIVGEVLALAARGNKPFDLQMTLRDFLDAGEINTGGKRRTIRQLVFEQLCRPGVRECIGETLLRYAYPSSEAAIEQETLLRDAGYTQATIGEAIKADGALSVIEQLLWRETLKHYERKPLRDLFVRGRGPEGFFEWDPVMFSPNRGSRDGAVNEKKVDLECGRLVVKVARLHDAENDCLNGYEWEARLFGDHDALQAVAVGSLYARKPRLQGSVEEYDLATMADQLSEADLLLMDALLPGADGDEDFVPELFEQGDMLAVLCWERHASAPAGSGRTCLAEAVRVLKKMYPRIRHLVMDGRPAQFVDWSNPEEHAELTVEKGEAVERLAKYVHEALFDDVANGIENCRLVYPCYDERTDPALRVLGKIVHRSM